MRRPQLERRVTPWKALWFADPTYSAVRIWQETDGRNWFQMHEWQRPDGTTSADGWIVGIRGWASAAAATDELAPGDRPALSEEEIRYLVDRLEGANDPLGISARAKLASLL